jgi:hypothetical protein
MCLPLIFRGREPGVGDVDAGNVVWLFASISGGDVAGASLWGFVRDGLLHLNDLSPIFPIFTLLLVFTSHPLGA